MAGPVVGFSQIGDSTMKWTLPSALCIVIVFVFFSSVGHGEEKGRKRTDSEKILSVVSNVEEFKGQAFFSASAARVAYPVKSGSKWFMVVDGRKDKPYDQTSRGRNGGFSPDGRRFAYVAQTGAKHCIVVDGKEGPKFDGVEGPVFSADGKRLAYAAKSGNRWSVVADGHKGHLFDSINVSSLTFSPDGRRLAYGAKKGRKWVLIIDGQESPELDYVDRPVFSPDSKRVAFSAKADNRWTVVSDGKTHRPYDYVEAVLFSPDSKRLGYIAKMKQTALVVVDGREGETFKEIGKNSLVFGRNGRIAYRALENGKWYVIGEDIPRRPFEAVGDGTPLFAADGTGPVFAAKTDDGWRVITPDREGQAYYYIWDGSLAVSQDGTELAYRAVKREPAAMINVVVVNAAEGKGYDSTGAPRFAPDGKTVVYKAKVGGKWFAVAGGREGKGYDEILTDPVVTANRTIRFVARNGTTLLRVEEPL